MEVTILQVFGLVLIMFGAWGLFKGEIEWSISVGPQTNRKGIFQINLNKPNIEIAKGVWKGKWVGPICAVVFSFGLLLLFVIIGEKVAFTI